MLPDVMRLATFGAFWGNLAGRFLEDNQNNPDCKRRSILQEGAGAITLPRSRVQHTQKATIPFRHAQPDLNGTVSAEWVA